MNNTKKQNQMTSKLVIIAFILPLALQVCYFVFQVSQKVLSIWNIIATGMFVGIFVFAIKMAKPDKDKNKYNKIPDPDIVTGGSTIDYTKQKESKKSKKALITTIIILVISTALSIIFFNVYNNKTKGLEVVNSKVISQWGDTIYETEETDDGIVQSEKEYIEVEVEYAYNGELRTATIKGSSTSKIYVDELKIYVDKNGNFVSDYGRILVWKLEALAFLCLAVLILLITIFSLGVEFIAGSIFTFIGTALFLLVGCQFIENIFYNDIVCFLAMFVNLGIYMLIYGFLELLFSKINKDKSENLTNNSSLPNSETNN